MDKYYEQECVNLDCNKINFHDSKVQNFREVLQTIVLPLFIIHINKNYSVDLLRFDFDSPPRLGYCSESLKPDAQSSLG